MSVPRLTERDVGLLVPSVTDVGPPMIGGQKIVFPCLIAESPFVLKFMLAPPWNSSPDTTEEQTIDFINEVIERAKREVQTLNGCNCEYVVKLGPIPLTRVEYQGKNIIYFSEEYIGGKSLSDIISTTKTISVDMLIRLALDINSAIEAMWNLRKVHRDIKPGNIMIRASNGKFVLLDMGLAFDLEGPSLTEPGMIVGTRGYYSPEQIEFSKKRQMDFRSDHFLLGIVLYEAGTGVHPFMKGKVMRIDEILTNILEHNPKRPDKIRKEIPPQISNVIMRLLSKKPHQRYRSCEHLMRAINSF